MSAGGRQWAPEASRRPRRRAGLPVALALGLLIAGCTAAGPPENALAQRLTWFSYLNGDDLRLRCAAATPPVFRLVYNAVFTEQVRAYEVIGLASGGARLETRIWRGSNLLRLDLVDPINRPTMAVGWLDAREFADLIDRLAASGFFASAPDGLTLRSDDYYWLVAGCSDGVLHVNGYPIAEIPRLAAVELLARHDPTGEPLPTPRRLYLPPFGARIADTRSGFGGPYFLVELGPHGLNNVTPF